MTDSYDPLTGSASSGYDPTAPSAYDDAANAPVPASDPVPPVLAPPPIPPIGSDPAPLPPYRPPAGLGAPGQAGPQDTIPGAPGHQPVPPDPGRWQQPSTDTSSQPGPRKPNTRRATRLGGALIAAGVLGLGAAVVGLAGSVSEVVDSEDIVTASKPLTMTLEEGDKRTLWAQDWGPRPACTVLGPDRRSVVLSQSSSNVSQNGQEFQSIGHFEADEEGAYVASCANGEARVTEGSPFDGLGIGLGGIFGGVLAIIAGAFVLARGAVRRVGYEIKRPRPRPRHRRLDP